MRRGNMGFCRTLIRLKRTFWPSDRRRALYAILGGGGEHSQTWFMGTRVIEEFKDADKTAPGADKVMRMYRDNITMENVTNAILINRRNAAAGVCVGCGNLLNKVV